MSTSLQAPAPPKSPSQRPSSGGSALCPRCSGPFDRRSATCPSCQFSLATARQAFPFAAPPLDFVVDPARFLPEGAIEELQAPYHALQARFPQLALTLALLKLAPGTSPREFAFWWFNDAPGGSEERQWHLLLLVDAQSGTLCLTPGYALESAVLSRPLAESLSTTAATVVSQGLSEALRTFLTDARTLLDAHWLQTRAEQASPPDQP